MRAQGDRWHAVHEDRVSVAVGSAVELQPEARDQFGGRFPPERLLLGVDLDRDCRNLVDVDEHDGRGLTIRAGTRQGSCDLVVWVPGNLNLDQRLRIEVTGRGKSGYDRGEAEQLATWLYRAILGREPDAGGIGAAIAEIERGRVGDQVEAMCGSREYLDQRRGVPAHERLADIYRGLLGREPDAAGVRRYQAELERGRCAEVVLDILRSDELESRLQGR